MKKVLARIGTLLLVMAMTLAIIPGAAFADTTTNTINLTKLTKATGIKDVDTDGQVIADTSNYGSPLDGVTFTLYLTDISVDKYIGVATTDTPAEGELPMAGSAAATAKITSNAWTVAKTGTTGAAEGAATGTIQWTGLADGIYYLVETGHPSTVATESAPAYIMLPYTYTTGNNAGLTTNTVYVYPKNTMATPTVDATKVSDNNTTDAKTNNTYEVAANGETVNFTSSFTLGTTTPDITSLIITDTMASTLSVPAAVTVTLGSTQFTAVTDYTLTPDTNAFTVEFTAAGLAKVKANYSSTNNSLVVKYASVYTGTTGTSSTNKIAIATKDSNPDSETKTAEDTAMITTGSAKITKYQADGTTPLPNVTFTLTKPDGSTVDAVTDPNGVASWTGLGDGDYTIKETKTVATYALNPEVKTFAISSVVSSIEAGNTNLNYVGTMSNYKQPILPLTGGTGIAMIVIAGIALIGGAVVLMKKRNIAK